MPGVDPSWSRLVQAVDAEGVLRTWHVLDNDVAPQAGTLLCVHGNPTWSFYWRNLIVGLRDRFRCVAVDHIGCGLSDKPQRHEYTLQRRIHDLPSIVIP